VSPRQVFLGVSVLCSGAVAGLSTAWPAALWAFVLLGPVILLGLYDMVQKRHAILRNFPIIGHGRYMMEMVRPEISQYFIESNTSGTPFNREMRSIVYRRAKDSLDTMPFGTQRDLYAEGFEWLEHSLAPKEVTGEPPRITIGGSACTQPYASSVLNISAMSYGSLSDRAVKALNLGARRGGFAHNTGEGGLSPHHEHGGDIVWQLGTGNFGARTPEGEFSPAAFEANASKPCVKMIELKLSQGAKPGHGGILPARKVTAEIAACRGVPLGRDVISPPQNPSFGTPEELVRFVAKLRELSGGKPVGIKLCIGNRREFFALCKAMQKLGVSPDFITVDGAEGGTGAAPVEFSNWLGTPLTEGLVFAHNALVGAGLRDEIKVIASGKVITGFQIARNLCIGADLCNSARGMMMALGCIQARRCNDNRCPTGVATQDPSLVVGLAVDDKARRVYNFHHATVHAFREFVAAAGYAHPSQLVPSLVQRRISPHDVRSYAELHDYLTPGQFATASIPAAHAADWAAADPARY